MGQKSDMARANNRLFVLLACVFRYINSQSAWALEHDRYFFLPISSHHSFAGPEYALKLFRGGGWEMTRKVRGVCDFVRPWEQTSGGLLIANLFQILKKRLN